MKKRYKQNDAWWPSVILMCGITIIFLLFLYIYLFTNSGTFRDVIPQALNIPLHEITLAPKER